MENLRLVIREILKEVSPKAKKVAGKLPSGKISASSDYMKKEVVRKEIQDYIKSKILSGEISDQEQFTAWCESASLAILALKMVPIEILKK